MSKAQAYVEEVIMLGTKLMYVSSYLAILLSDTDPDQAVKTEEVQLGVMADLKPFQGKLDSIYDQYIFPLSSEQEAAVSTSKLKSYFRLVCHYGGPASS